MNNRYYINKEREEARQSIANERALVVKQQKITLILLFIAAVLVSTFVLSGNVHAESEINNRVKLYKSVMIYTGDTLESIAADYISDEYASDTQYVNEIIMINNLSDASKIVPGNKIIVPYYADKDFDNDSVRTYEFKINL